MVLFGIDLGNYTDTFTEIFHEDNFDPVQARHAMAIICSIFFAHNAIKTDPDVEYCNATHDSFSCWPATPAGQAAEIRCPDFPFTDPSENTTRLCLENGTWSLASYNNCFSQKESLQIIFKNDGIQRIIYCIGYTITCISLIVALTIFVYFRSLRCLRNTIHCHLIVAFFFNNISYILMFTTYMDLYHHPHGWICRVAMTLINYFVCVPYYWMFVEGLYLYTTVVWAFALQKIKLCYYVMIGWGTPLVTTLTWAIVRANYYDSMCWIHLPQDIEQYNYGYILYAPIMLLLVINVFFIAAIVWVLVTKLRASNSLETRRSRKAVRATFVLLPLLGVTLVLFMKPPLNDPVTNVVFDYINTILQSVQGLFVAVIYCFMNGEVKTVLRKKFMSIQDSRTLTRYTKSSIFSSPHRSSGYAMHQLSAPGLGKSNGDSKKNGNDRRFSRLSRTEELESESCTCMIENVT